MPRLIRRRPLAERIKAYLDPADFLLWLSEELDSSDWDQWQRDWATPIGLLLNVIFLIARANSGYSRRTDDDVFGDNTSYSSWSSWLVRNAVICCTTHVSNANHDLAGCVHRTLFDPRLIPQCVLYLLSPAPLPTLRKQCRRRPKHPIRPPCPSQLLARNLLSSTLSIEHHCR